MNNIGDTVRYYKYKKMNEIGDTIIIPFYVSDKIGNSVVYKKFFICESSTNYFFVINIEKIRRRLNKRHFCPITRILLIEKKHE